MTRRTGEGSLSSSLTAQVDPATVAARSSRPRMLWDLSSLAAGQVLSVVLGFAGFAWLARTLSPASYGVVEYAVGLTALATMVIEGGTGSIGTLHVARDPGRARELAGQVSTARLLMALLVVPLLGLSGLLTSADAGFRTLVWLFAISLFAVVFKQDWLLQGLGRMTLVAPAQALKSGAFALGVVLLVSSDLDIVRIGLVEAIAAFLAAAYFLTAQRQVSAPLQFDLHPARAWSLVRAGAAIGASNLLWPFMAYAPILLVTNIAGSAEAAWLGGAQRIVVALVSFSALYFFNLYPLLGRSLRDDHDRWGRLMGSSFRVIAWSSIGFALALSLVATPVARLVFGDAFTAAGPVLAIAIWILPLRLLSGHARWSLLAAERQDVLLWVELGCAAAIVLLCGGLIPAYGAIGAAAAAVGGHAIGWMLAHLVTERYVGRLPVLRIALLPAAVALVAGSGAALAGGSLLVRSGLAIAAYAVAMRLAAPELFGDAVRLAYSRDTV